MKQGNRWWLCERCEKKIKFWTLWDGQRICQVCYQVLCRLEALEDEEKDLSGTY